MSGFRANSSPELLPSTNPVHQDDSTILEGVAANVKLLLKLIEDHHDASKEDDGRKPQRIAGMITIIDDVRSRIERSQFSVKRNAELRRCNTDLRRSGAPPKEKKPPQNPTIEENQKLRRELSASMTARKSLEKMFSSLGKEKELIAAELARKVQELTGMEELINDLRAQNEMLSEKVRVCAAEHKGKKGSYGGGDVVLQERNKTLSEQLLKSLDGYRSMKRRLKEALEERERVQARMAEMAEAAAAAVERMRGLRERGVGEGGMKEELCFLERVFAGFYKKLSSKGSPKRAE